MELARSLLGVATVFGLLGILLWAGRRRGVLIHARRPRTGTRMLEHLERLPLSPNHSVHVLRAGDRRLLIGVHNSGLVLLGDLPPQESPES